jgi:hypothetical protein
MQSAALNDFDIRHWGLVMMLEDLHVDTYEIVESLHILSVSNA